MLYRRVIVQDVVVSLKCDCILGINMRKQRCNETFPETCLYVSGRALVQEPVGHGIGLVEQGNESARNNFDARY